MPRTGRMTVQSSLSDVITREGQSTVWEMEIQFLQLVSGLSSTSGPGPAETPGCGSVRAAWQSLRGSDSERLVLSLDAV